MSISPEEIEACKESFLDEQAAFSEGSIGYEMLADNIAICDLALAHVRAEAYFESVGVAQWETSEVIMNLRELRRGMT